MAGLLVNQYHWRKSREEFKQFCNRFRSKFGVDFKELKAADVYAGRKQWNNISYDRHEVLEYCINWLKDRPHKIIVAAVIKKALERKRHPFQLMLFPIKKDVPELSPYLLSALHISLMFQRYLESLKEDAYKTIGMIIFDEQQKHEQNKLLDLLISPPKSIVGFTNKISREGFCCIMDNAYFISSHYSSFIQLADIAAFIIRKTAEFRIRFKESYKGEKNKIENWFSTVKDLFIEERHRFPANCEIVEMYRKITPKIFP